jgi:hypothetical protein
MTMALSTAKPSRGRSSRHGLWGITCFFNPSRSRRRLENYQAFRRSLGVPLVTVELAYGPQPELHEEDADILIPLRGKDILWQKERLLNLALEAVPRDCDAIVWLDSDVLFERADWPVLVRKELERCVLLQPFQDTVDVGPNERAEEIEHACHSGLPSSGVQGPGVRRTSRPDGRPMRQSLAFKIATGGLRAASLGTARLRNQWRCAVGLAWAGRCDALARHRFYDAEIVGGGDRALACAAYGSWQGLEATHHMNEMQRRHYLAWAQPFFDTVQGQVGHVPGTLFHLWHGTLDQRGYGTRFVGLVPFAFDPYTDIELDEQGCWRWSSNKTHLHQYVQRYFEQRNEGG